MNRAVCLAVAVLSSSAFAAEIANNEFMKLKLKVGGFFYGAMHYDTNASGNRPWLNAVSGDAGRGLLSAEPYGTRANLAIESADDGPNKGKGFLEIDWGTITTPRIRHAYVSVDFPFLSLLVGQTWVPSGAVGPDTYNPMWFFKQGNAYSRAPQVTLARAFGPLKLSATVTSGNLLGGGVVGTGYSLTEGLTPTGFLQLSYAILEKGSVQLTGGAGRAEATATGQPRTGAETRYAELAFTVPVSRVTLTGKAFYSVGAGLGTAVGQTLVIDGDGRAAAIPSAGGFASVKVSILPKLSAAAYLGLDDPRNVVAGVQVPTRRNLSFGAHVTYLPVDALNLALEAERVATEVQGAAGVAEYSDVRLSLVTRYHF